MIAYNQRSKIGTTKEKFCHRTPPNAADEKVMVIDILSERRRMGLKSVLWVDVSGGMLEEGYLS